MGSKVLIVSNSNELVRIVPASGGGMAGPVFRQMAEWMMEHGYGLWHQIVIEFKFKTEEWWQK